MFRKNFNTIVLIIQCAIVRHNVRVVVSLQPQMELHKYETLGSENITGGNEGI